MKKNIGRMLIGAVLGFVSMYLLLGMELDMKDFSFMSFEITIICMVVSLLAIIFSLFGYIKIKADAKKDVTGDEEDEREGRQYKRYADISLAVNIAMCFSMAMIALVTITDQHYAFILISLVLFVLTTFLSFVNLELVKIIYPDRDFPSVSDKQFAKKLLNMSDEGERHVMLEGIYRSFSSLNSLLVIAVLVLIGYSIISGVSQLFGIFTILLILVITNVQYMLSIRKK